MGSKTDISWTDSTWSPLRARVREDAVEIAKAKGYTSLLPIIKPGRVGPHCEHASPGCENCYSETNNSRCLPHNGTGLPFDRRSRDLVEMFIDDKILMQPLSWKKPRKIFLNSQTDTFGEFSADEMIDRMMAVAALCQQHTIQVLTKRAERMHQYWSTPNRFDEIRKRMALISSKIKPEFELPLPNVWLGVSVENQEQADKRIPWLLKTPAAIRWISAEPLLGPIALFHNDEGVLRGPAVVESGGMTKSTPDYPPEGYDDSYAGIDQCIVGGESGHGARPMNVRWVSDLILQCRDAGVACFVKQMGAKPIANACRQLHYEWGEGNFEYFYGSNDIWRIKLKSRSGSDMQEWPDYLRVREFPEVSA